MTDAQDTTLQEKLDIYAAMLGKWQKAVNLVGPSTLEDAAHRHFDDSLQILPDLLRTLCASRSDTPPGAQSVPDNRRAKLVDLGSGAGFPGLVLAMAAPALDVHLIESDQKKCAFLQTVSRETGITVHVHPERIEACGAILQGADFVTARALAALDTLLAYAAPAFASNAACTAFFLKGRNAAAEIEEARRRWTFSCRAPASRTDPEARLLIVTGLACKKLEP